MDHEQIAISASGGISDHARYLHRAATVILAHDHLSGWNNVLAMQEGGVTAKVIKLTVDGIDWHESGLREEVYSFDGWTKRALQALDRVLCLAEEHPQDVIIARSVADLCLAKSSGMVALILGLEGARPLEGSLEVLRVFHRVGLREMQLTWAAPNQLISNGELNDFGRDVVREMNRLGMLIDLSHLPPKAWEQTLELSDAPVIMSHNACHAITQYGDTMTDEALLRLAAADGLLAMHFVSGDYIKPRYSPEQAILDDFIDHIDHARQLIGIDRIALGGDYFYSAPGDGWKWVREIERIELMPNLTEALLRRGYSDDEIMKILGGNLLRLYQRVWKG